MKKNSLILLAVVLLLILGIVWFLMNNKKPENQINEEINGENIENQLEENVTSSLPSLVNNLVAEGADSTTWDWVKAVKADGVEIVPKNPVFTMTFGFDGSVNGATDCNGYFGTYRIRENYALSFGPLASTMMYCEGSEEGIFTGLFTETSGVYEVDGNELTIKLNDGTEVYFQK